MPGPVFESKWPKTKCPACGDPWEVGDKLAYNDEDVVVHAQCAYEHVPVGHYKHKGKSETVCPKCFLTSCDCE